MSFESASGVVLGRRMVGEGDLLLSLFLKGIGLTSASARGAAMGKVRFGGGTEPLVWGVFTLYLGRGGKKHLKGVDVADDMLPLRGRPEVLFAAVHWVKLLRRRLMEVTVDSPSHPSDGLLANLYWNMKLLCSPQIPVEAVEWRFLRRWLKDWGLAPALSQWADCWPNGLELLRRVAAAKVDDFLDLDLLRALEPHRRLFRDAARRAESYLTLYS
ncbi:MAG: recombination protein O N-terminal domain-containing protein [Synergistaceae bacterium]|jgi:DNA repair protein RecO (recombination protein O)|nr:recombination protein O N-terminal domain-containing protein [Synergistaceae bacterium]